MYYVYVLKNDNHNRLYIGVSTNASRRLIEHNSGKTKSTKPYRPYSIVYLEEFVNKSDALRREKQIKSSGKIRK